MTEVLGPAGPSTGVPSSRAAVLDAIRAAGTVSRVELTAATGLTGATVSTTVRRLIEDGLVQETGLAESTGGKRRVLLELVPTSRHAVGVHLDGTDVTYALVNLDGAVVARLRRTSPAGDPESVVHGMAETVRGLVDSAGASWENVLGLGVVSPGPLSRGSRLVLTGPAMGGWADFPLGRRLGEATGLPVVVDNDATAAAVGEHWTGGAGGSSAFAALYLATGIGAGAVLDGVPLRGVSSNAGEVGHVCVEVDGPECWCGSRGCVEALGGPRAVVAAAEAAGFDLGGTDRPVSVRFAALARAALAGDAVAANLLHRSARYVAVAAQTLAQVLDVDRLVLTGPAMALAGSLYLPAVRERLAASSVARHVHDVEVVISSAAAEAAAIGAAALVLQGELVSRAGGVRIAVG
ncbi:ROK family protein [Isoptericola sp. NPDC056573]|uniref:ROK family transcriptional regulator n=1 Tax=Isoptericola sp. NPDC056573 TaxID=3345868 RepID=UPI00368A7115